jgi:hypothetical protein
VARKCTAKKLKITESTSQKVGTASSVVKYFLVSTIFWQLSLLMSQDISLSDPADQGEEETWDTVGGATEWSVSPAPTTRVVVPEATQQATGADDSHASAEERRPDPSPATRAEQPEEAQFDDEVTAEVGIVDIPSILGAPTVTVVRSSL